MKETSRLLLNYIVRHSPPSVRTYFKSPKILKLDLLVYLNRFIKKNPKKNITKALRNIKAQLIKVTDNRAILFTALFLNNVISVKATQAILHTLEQLQEDVESASTLSNTDLQMIESLVQQMFPVVLEEIVSTPVLNYLFREVPSLKSSANDLLAIIFAAELTTFPSYKRYSVVVETTEKDCFIVTSVFYNQLALLLANDTPVDSNSAQLFELITAVFEETVSLLLKGKVINTGLYSSAPSLTRDSGSLDAPSSMV